MNSNITGTGDDAAVKKCLKVRQGLGICWACQGWPPRPVAREERGAPDGADRSGGEDQLREGKAGEHYKHWSPDTEPQWYRCILCWGLWSNHNYKFNYLGHLRL